MTTDIIQGRVPHVQLAGIIAVLSAMNQQGRAEEVGRKASRDLFEGVCACQKSGEREQADDLLEQAELVSQLVELP